MKIRIRSIKKQVDLGMLKTLRYLNWGQRANFIGAFMRGELLSQYTLRGGKNYADKTFYIIRRDYRAVGLFSMYITNAGHIDYALKHGYIPVVDMCNYKNCYLEDDLIGQENAWEYYFKQPSGFTIKEAYMGANIILSDIGIPDYRPSDRMSYFNNRNEINHWRIIGKKYMKINEDIVAEAQRIYRKITHGAKVLGVALRGTDYVRMKPHDHPVQPSVDQVMNDSKSMMDEKGCPYLYLSTEDCLIVEEFKKRFDDKCIVYNRQLVSYENGYIIRELNKQNKDSRRYNGRQYLISILLLAQTNVLLASRASSVVGVEMLSNGWEYSFFGGTHESCYTCGWIRYAHIRGVCLTAETYD